MKKDKELAKHLIQFCKDNGIPNEIPPEKQNEYKGWYLPPLDAVPKINTEIKRYYEKEKLDWK